MKTKTTNRQPDFFFLECNGKTAPWFFYYLYSTINSAAMLEFYLMNLLRFSYDGIFTVNTVRSASLSAVIVPPWAVTISFAMARPRPAPPVLEEREVSRR